jgi:hypothetical protein
MEKLGARNERLPSDRSFTPPEPEPGSAVEFLSPTAYPRPDHAVD